MSVFLAVSDWPYVAVAAASLGGLVALRLTRPKVTVSQLSAEKEPIASRPHRPPTPAHLPVLAYEELIDRTGSSGRVATIREKLAFAEQNFRCDVEPLLRSFAEFVQMLPASESHHHAQPGGLLIHLLEVAQFALHFRDSYKLPLGTTTEEQLRLAARYSYAVLVAALLHDIGKPVADVQVDLSDDEGHNKRAWVALAGGMSTQGASWYSVAFPEKRDYDAHKRLPVVLLQRLVPASALTWLGEYPPLLQELMGYLSGDKTGGSIAEIVLKADQKSVAGNLATGPRTRFASARSVPLIERLMDALRRILAEGNMPMNRAGATGYCDGESLWCVAGTVAKLVREYLDRNEQRAAGAAGIPEDNARLFDTWQEYGALVTNPAGGAVWNIRVRIGEWEQPFTVLRFPLKHLYQSPEKYPSALPLGAITPVTAPAAANNQPADSANNTASRTANARDTAGSAHAPETTPGTSGAGSGISELQQPAVGCNDELSAPSFDGPTNNCAPSPLDEPGAPPVADDPRADADASALPTIAVQADTSTDDYPEFLEEIESAGSVEMSGPAAAPTAQPPAAPLAPIKPKQRETKVPTESRAARAAGPKVRPNAERFLAWIQQGIADGSIEYNEAGAFIHFVPEGMLVVSPKAFKEYAERFESSIEQSEPASKESWQIVQRDFQRSGYALKADGGTYMHYYNVSGPGGKRLVGQLVTEPARLFSQVPPSNPLVQSKAKSRIENGLSN